MKAPLSWLKEYISLTQSPEKLSDVFTLAGLEVDAITPYVADFKGVVSALVVEAKPHPNAHKLQIATVFDGNETIQVVCAAKNCRAGVITALAKVGARLKITSENFEIQKANLRGEDSYGMLCAEDELSFSEEKSEGILELPADFPVGVSLENLVHDLIFDISLTPNLGHCLSMMGLCRELKAHLQLPMDLPQIHFQESTSTTTEDFISVQIDNPEDCHHYSCRLIYNLQSTKTPWFIKNALQKVGIRSKHLVVDVLNYVMIESGQPMHAFDYNKMHTKKLHVTRTRETVEFTTLDGTLRKIPAGTLVIADETKPLAIAGIMGGAETAIDESSQMILLEAAHFSPSLIRKGMKQLQLRSDSSNRFEKGIDQEGIQLALSRAVSLIQQYGHCEIAAHPCAVIRKPYSEKKITCHYRNVSRILGIDFSKSEIEHYLHRLDIGIRFHGDDSYHVSIPSYRNDIQTEIDVIEEIARIYGYNNIPMRAPVYSSSIIPHNPMFAFEKTLRSIMLGQGLQELLSCDLLSPAESKIGPYAKAHEEEVISVVHAKSEDQSVLRTSFIPGFIQCAERNKNYGHFDIAGFEIGKLHFKDGCHYKEKLALGILLSGNTTPEHYTQEETSVNFLDLKGIVENLFEALHIEDPLFSKTAFSVFHPGQQAQMTKGSSLLGIAGQLHPTLQKSSDLRFPLYYAQIDIETLYREALHKYSMKPLPLFPSSERDLTLHLHKGLPMQKVFSAIEEAHLSLLESITLTDTYESESLGSDRLSATFRFVYRDKEKTIESQDVEKTHSQILPILQEKLQGFLFN